MKIRYGVLITVLAVVIGAGASATAAPIIFFGENLHPGGLVSGAPLVAHNAFLAGLVGVGTETFEGQAGLTTPLPLTFPGSIGNITATLTGLGGVCDTSSGTVGGIGCNGFGRFPTSGNSWFHTTAPGFAVDFSSPIAAFGFYGTDIGDFSGQLTATATGGTTVNFVIPNTINAPDGSLLFWGFIDQTNTYSRIEFSASNGTDVFGFDDLTVGDLQQVRVPDAGSSLLLLGMALAGLRAARTRLL